MIRVQHRMVLINGQRFADLMLKHGVGVRVRATYTIQTVDENFFRRTAVRPDAKGTLRQTVNSSIQRVKRERRECAFASR